MTSAPLDLTDRATALRAARQAGIALEHRLGQHLLVDRRALESIVQALAPGPEDAVLEIGPGIGTLTVELARRAARVVAVELDPACARAARRHTQGVGSVEVVQGDALRIEPASLGLGPRWLAAGNIPYTITGALLTHLLEREDPPQRAVLLVQREVAARLAARAGDWSLSFTTTVGVVDPSGNWYLRKSNGSGAPDAGSFPYGLGNWTPLFGAS